MAKIKHNNFIDTVDEVIAGAKKEGVVHLYAEDKVLTGRTIQINGKEMFHFGTTGYLGLEQDIRLKDAAIQAIRDYGTQFPLSKSYISHPLYYELESKIEQMYGIPPIITKNSTLGHLAIIPTLIRDEDAVIMDHQVHWSVQNACQLLKLRGIPVEMIRHSNLEMLEDKIRQLSSKCNKIWYMADGVYSMFGDYAPIPELLTLSQKYTQLYLYFDDVHGMSWKGKNGTGFIFDAIGELPENCIVVSTLSKTFGASGATIFCKNQKLRDKIKNFGGPLTFSAQLEPASVAAAIASADIHLSTEILSLQSDLSEKIEYFKSLLEKTDLPMIALNNSPVFFLGTAMPLTAYKMVQRLFNDGFYVNPAIYPAVPIKNTGIRITLSRHNQKEEIKALVEAMKFHFPKALEESGNSKYKVKKAFRIAETIPQIENREQETTLVIQYETSIVKINKQTWDELLGKQSTFDWEGLLFLENAFTNTDCAKNNWDFHYYVITDKNGIPVLTTFFTYGLWKDDMLASESISLQLEEKRKQNPLYLTSKVLGMGSLFTEGNHCYINKTHPLAEEAIMLLLEQVETLYHQLNADMLVLRDFEEDEQLNHIFNNHGFLKINMPETCIIQNNKWDSMEEFSATLSSRSRKHFMKEVLPFEKAFDIVIKEKLTKEESEQAYKLYQNVKNNNHAINTFTYPIEVFQKMENHHHWEFILLYLNNNNNNNNRDQQSSLNLPIGILFCYKNTNHTYVPALIGMDYSYAKEFQLYRQLLFQAIKRARELKLNRIDFGVSATFEKRKLGATVISKIAYIQARDNFSMELMGTLQNDDKIH
ncbi:aminotransferase class I/II-fold pyridoxal phosphate-dependent enzyme [Flavobacterium sp. LS2P90]|uniref:Aminotransferase class I/II-fold pyridoxal phosphate-dependent enzyme n=1 Tax=Flavobacterium xylosi TaxID=3230415 RepID=A0ABW6HSL4_9FLAO